MADSRRIREIDGLSAVKAVQHARQQPPRAPPSAGRAPPEKRDDDQKPQAKFSRTALPTKYEMFCYECGHSFVVAGHVRALVCNHCKTALNQADFTLATRFSETIKTTGTVTIGTDGVVESGVIAARDVILEGRVEGGQVRAFRRLDVRPGSVFDQSLVTALDLSVAAGATLKLDSSMAFRHVEIAGALEGELEASGVVHVTAQGSFEGTLRAEHVIVDEGAGLLGEMHIGVPVQESGLSPLAPA